MAEKNIFFMQKDLFYKINPNGTDEEFYAQPEIKQYTKEYQDQVVVMGEDKFQQYEYKVELIKEGRYLIARTDYKIPEDGTRILTQKYGGEESCYVTFISQVNLGGIKKLVADCEASRSYKPRTSLLRNKIIIPMVIAITLFLYLFVF